MTEQLTYHTLEALEALSLEELQALWDLVPTERQKAYRAAYTREVRNGGAIGSDDLEHRVADELLRRYRESALVPVGSRWARTPLRVQAAAKDNSLPEAGDETEAQTGRPSPRVVVVVSVLLVLLVGFLLFRLPGRGGSQPGDSEMLAEASPTPAARVSPTPTPLALEAQDEVITGGDTQRAVAYPVNLQVVLPDQTAPCVWVVQRREVRAAEWNFDPNPDIASFINGMSVRPVMGIPWSEDNAATFAGLGPGTLFNVTLNTGAVLRYEFAARDEVLRSATHIFRQVSPGLVLLLIGQTDEQGQPSATRTLVTASYPPEQELGRDGELAGLALAAQVGSVGDSLALGAGSVTLRDVQGVDDLDDLSPDQQALRFSIDVAAGDTALETSLWRAVITDAGGQVYPSVADTLPAQIPALALFPVTLDHLIPADLVAGRWTLSDGHGTTAAFRFTLAAPPVPPAHGALDVRLVQATYGDGQLTTQLRIFNGEGRSLRLTQDDLWLALGYAPDPPGPRNPAEGLTPFDLLPDQAVDLTLVWVWAGEPYAALQVADYRFAIQIAR